ncbi:MAG TPA: hypothetical protein VGA82_06740, partial [Dehalococcoidales bacterium]
MSGAVAMPLRAKEAKRYPFLVDVLIRLVKEKPLGTVGGVIVLLLLVVGILANVLSPYGFNDIYVGGRLSPPSGDFLLGTDNLG